MTSAKAISPDSVALLERGSTPRALTHDLDWLARKMMERSLCLVILAEAVSQRVVYQNQRSAQRLSRGALPDAKALTLPQLFAPREQGRLVRTIQTLNTKNPDWEGECALLDAQGKEFLAHGQIHILSEGGRAYLCVHAYPHPSKAEEEEIVSDHKILRALLDTVPDSIYLKDAQSRFLMVSKSMAQRCGLNSAEEMIGRTDFDYFTAEHAQPAYDAERRIIENGEHILGLEEKETWQDGLVTWVSTTKLPLHDADGKIIGLFGLSRDITLQKADAQERSELEAKLQLAGKLESIGRLSAGIAHEINTPTQFIAHNTHFIADAANDLIAIARQGQSLQLAVDKKDSEQMDAAARAFASVVKKLDLDYLIHELPRTIGENLEGLQRVQQIVRSLKEYAHPASREKIHADLNAAIRTAMNVAKHEWKYLAEITLELDASLPHVPCNISEINQVLVNLIVNAAHAIESKLRKTGEKKGLITLRSYTEETHTVVEVADTGTGIPEAVRGNIFNPFFTTKPMGKGTGQGLHLVQTIINQNHGGSVDFSTEVGAGTTFRFKLPFKPQGQN